MQRRQFIASGIALLAHYFGSPEISWAQDLLQRNSDAFDAGNPASVYAALGIEPPTETRDILIEAPDVAENGAKVPVEVLVRLPDVERILLVGERNRFPLLADVSLTPRMQPWFEAQVRLAEDSSLRVIAQSRGALYTSSKPIRVIVGGCLTG